MKIYNTRFGNQRCLLNKKDIYLNISKQIFRKINNKIISFNINKKVDNILTNIINSSDDILVYNYPLYYQNENKCIISYIDILLKKDNKYIGYTFVDNKFIKMLPGLLFLKIKEEFHINNLEINIVNLKNGQIQKCLSDNQKYFIQQFMKSSINLQYCRGCDNCEYK